MNSQIKVDYCDLFGHGVEPVIRVDLITSDDPRDKLLNSLFESLGPDKDYINLVYVLSPYVEQSKAETIKRIYLYAKK